MHKLFQIPELVGEIVSWTITKRDQLHFGLTCRQFLREALPHMWRNVDSHALTTLLFAHLSPEETDDSLIFSRPVQDAEWELLLRYGNYIKGLRLSNTYDEAYVGDPELLEARVPWVFGTPANSSGMLNGLKSLELNVQYTDSLADGLFILALERFLAAPFMRSVLSIKIAVYPVESVERYAPPLARLINAIQPTHSLQDFEVSVHDGLFSGAPGHALQSTLGSVVSQLAGLKTLKVVVLSNGNDVIPVAARLPSLEVFTIHNYCTDEFVSATLRAGAFPSLRALHIVEYYAEAHFDFHSLLCSISSPFVEKIALCCYEGNISVIPDMFRHVVRKWCSSVVDLGVDFLWQDDESFPVHELFSLLHSLTACGNLQALRVKSQEGRPFQLTDDQIDVMSAAWRKLRVFEIEDVDVTEPIPVPYMTKRSLELLASRCIHLHRLTLSIDFDAVVDAPPQEYGTPTSSVETLNIGHSQFSQLSSTASFLRRTFPCLKGIWAQEKRMDALSHE